MTSYKVDSQSGLVTEKINRNKTTAPIDKVIKVGNAEKIGLQFQSRKNVERIQSLDKDTEKLRTQVKQESWRLPSLWSEQSHWALLSCKETSAETKAMKPKVILVGTKENKPHLLPDNKD